MSKKTKLEGFRRPIDLDYSLANDPDQKGNNLATYYYTSNPTAATNSYQWQPFSQLSNQAFEIVKVYFDVLAQTNAGVPLVIADFKGSLFSTPSGFNTSYPAGLYSNNYGIITSSGNPSNKTIMIDCGDGVAVKPGETVVFDFTAYKTAAWAVTDSIYVRVAMIWR